MEKKSNAELKVINASAGTGKTEFILNLVFKDDNDKERSADDVREILKNTVILSFSNAAVEELRARIYDRAGARFGVEKATIQEKIEKIPQPRVHTIHSFVMELARILRYDLGLPAGLEFDMGREKGIWHDSCERFFSEQWGYKMKKLPLLKGPAEQELFDLFYHLSNQKMIKNFIKEKGRQLFFLSEGFAADGLKSSAAKKKSHISSTAIFQYKKDLEDLRINMDELKKDPTKLKDGVKPAIAELLKCTPIITALCETIGNEYYIPSMFESGIFEYDGLVYKLCLFLSNKKAEDADWLTKRLSRENFAFENLYVDEAQDNDIMQNYLIYSIIPNSINKVIVGDPKQSIFRFRNAFPAQFIMAYDEAPKYDKKTGRWPKNSTLKSSYRIKASSTLNYLNHVFKKTATHANVNPNIKLWDYNIERDELQQASNATDKNVFEGISSDIRVFNLDKALTWKTQLENPPAFINDVFCTPPPVTDNKGFKIGVLTKDRKQMKNSGILEQIKALGLSNNVKFKLSLEMEKEIPMQQELISILVEMNSRSKRNEVPMRLMFTKAGRLILNASGFMSSKIKLADALSHLRAKIDEYREVNTGRGIIRPACEMLDGKMSSGNNVWQYMSDNGSMLQHEEIVRAISFALNALWQEEAEYGSAFTGEEASEMIMEMKMPFEWFGVAEALNRDMTGSFSIEVATIHSSKGKAYDKVVVLQNLSDDLRQKPDLREHFDGKDFNTLMSLRFQKVITDSPQMKVSCFPYIKIASAIKDGVFQPADFPEITELYENNSVDALSQNYNLFYVALTRTKKDIILMGKMEKGTEKKPQKLDHIIGSTTGELLVIDKEDAEKPTDFIKAKEVFKILDIPDAIASRTVRSEVEPVKKHGGFGKMSAEEKYYRINTGSAAHSILQATFTKMKQAADYEKIVKESAKAGDRYGKIESADAAAALLSTQGAVEAKDLAQKLAGTEFRPEMRLWKADYKGLLKGSADGVFIGKDKVYVAEFKTVFGKDNSGQKELGLAQVKKYSELIEKLVPKEYTVAGNKENWEGVITINMRKDK